MHLLQPTLCIFCKSNSLIHNPERYDVDASLIEEAKNFIHQGADLDEETFDRILRLTEADQPFSVQANERMIRLLLCCGLAGFQQHVHL